MQHREAVAKKYLVPALRLTWCHPAEHAVVAIWSGPALVSEIDVPDAPDWSMLWSWLPQAIDTHWDEYWSGQLDGDPYDWADTDTYQSSHEGY
jgi:hypothetical protein